MAIDVGSTYRSSLKVYNDQGVLTAPATKVYTVTLPDQTTSTPAVQTNAPGDYYADYLIAQEGIHKFSWVTTTPGTTKTDYENAWVYRSVVGLQEMRDYMSLLSTAKDDMVRSLMMAATEMAEKIVGTCIQKTWTGVDIPGRTKPQLRLIHGPLLNTTGNITISSAWPGGPSWINNQSQTALLVYPDSAVVEPLDMRGFWLGPWKATYVAGRTIIPQRVVLAVKIIVMDLFSMQRETLTDPLSPSYDEATQYAARIPAGYEMPAQARALLLREARPGFA